MTPTPKLPTNRSELNDLKKQKGPKRGPSTFQRSVAAFCMVLHPQQHPGNPIDYLVAHTPEFRGNKAIFNAPKVWLGDLLGYKICDDDQ
jgi:hypothetical protein